MLSSVDSSKLSRSGGQLVIDNNVSFFINHENSDLYACATSGKFISKLVKSKTLEVESSKYRIPSLIILYSSIHNSFAFTESSFSLPLTITLEFEGLYLGILSLSKISLPLCVSNKLGSLRLSIAFVPVMVIGK